MESIGLVQTDRQTETLLNQNKNHAIEWYRYFFSCFICALHFKEYKGADYPFGGAYLGVEFFFIVSGFFLMKTISEAPVADIGSATVAFWKKRVYRLYPHYILSWSILAAYCILVRHSVTIKDLLIHYVDEVLMLQMAGAGKHLNAALWYISALLLVSVVIFFLAHKVGRAFTQIVAPGLVLLIYSYFYQTRGTLAGVGWNNLLIVRDGFWRGLAGISLGCIVYGIYTHVSPNGQKLKTLRTIYEIGTLCLLSIMFFREGCTVKDFTLVGMMALLLLSIMCGGSYFTKLLEKVKIDGGYAYGMYCNHWVLNYFIHDFFPERPFYPMLCVYLTATVIMSVLTTKLVNWILLQCSIDKHTN